MHAPNKDPRDPRGKGEGKERRIVANEYLLGNLSKRRSTRFLKLRSRP